jgi:hypothetical protein
MLAGLDIEVNPACFWPIRFGPMGHMNVEPSDTLLGSCLLDVGVWMLGIDPDPDICVFAGAKVNVGPIVHLSFGTEERRWETSSAARPKRVWFQRTALIKGEVRSGNAHRTRTLVSDVHQDFALEFRLQRPVVRAHNRRNLWSCANPR